MIINVAYACNEAYMEQTTVSLISLFINNKAVDDIVIYFIDMGITEDSAKNLKQLAESYGRKLKVIPFKEIAYDLNVKNTGRHIQSVYAKLFFGRFTELDRILYLDSDIVVADSLLPLWNIDLKDNVCAGVETIHTIQDNEQMGLSSAERAINDGMVLMDLKKWRDENFLERCLKYIEDNNGEPPVLSEGTINAVCKGRIKIIDPRYNLMSAIVGESSQKIEILTGRKYYPQAVIDSATNNPCIIHYLSGFYNRPWCKQCTHPLKDEYLKYREMSRYADQDLSDKKLPVRIRIVGFLYRYLPIKIFVVLRKIIGGKGGE